MSPLDVARSLSPAQREHILRLSVERAPVKVSDDAGWRARVLDALAERGLVTLDMRTTRSRRTTFGALQTVPLGTWASLTDAGVEVASAITAAALNGVALGRAPRRTRGAS